MGIIMNTEDIIDKLAETNPHAIVLEPRSTFNRAIIESTPDGKLVYSSEKIIRAFMDEDEMSEEEAIEYFEYNTVRAIDYMPKAHRPLLKYTEEE